MDIHGLLFCIFFLSQLNMNAQNDWYVAAYGGWKASCHSSSKNIFYYSPRDGFSSAEGVTMAGQFGLRFGREIGSGKFSVESGLALSGHVHNFKDVWGEKIFLVISLATA